MRAETIRTIAGATLMLAAAPAGAETPLATLSGHWSGQGTDRETPMQSPQRTRCRVTVKADASRMATDTRCTGVAGLFKHLQLSVSFDGTQFSGTAEQVSRTGGGEPTRRAGTVSGKRTGDSASYTVRFPGLTPNAYVTVRLVSPTTFTLHVSTLGATLTDVTFHRPAR